MPLRLHSHPLASYCHKVLVALYEREIEFEAVFVDLGDPDSRARFLALSPLGKMPVLEGPTVVTESTTIIEWLELHHRREKGLVPNDPEGAWEVRRRDRFYDLHVQDPMQKIVGDRIRPAGAKDPHGVESAGAQLRTAYEIIEADMVDKTWATGDAFTMADCAAAPALYYANKVLPLEANSLAAAYLKRLIARPSYARVLIEAEPYLANFPQ